MTDADFWKRVDEAFQSIANVPPDRRADLLDRLDDPRLRDEVESLIRAHDASADFLRDPVTSRLDRADPMIGRAVGSYRIESRLGAGAMGVVYSAARADAAYEQRVVVKLIRAAIHDPDLERRFRRERQILASLDHPNIARLLDAGVTDDAQPFLVAELVDGEPITDYAEHHNLTLDERLDLFDQVCAAVQHAHANLVVHRDLKPAHVIVGDDRRPRLLDFGIAAILDDPAEPLETMADVRRFTPQYASPEQIAGEPITTAADVYALGLILYELLAGAPPYRVTGALSDADRRLIRDTDPAPPSRTLPDDAPPRLRRRLAGDLDTIVLTALRKEPARRYASAEALRADLARFRDGHPVAARPDTILYRTGKFVRRNRVPVAAAILITAALVGATAISTSFAVHAARQVRIANGAIDFVRDDLLGRADPNEQPDPDVTLRTVLDRAAGTVGDRFEREPLVHAAISLTLGAAYLGLGEPGEALRHDETALELRERALGPDHPETLRARSAVVAALIEAGDFNRAATIVPELLHDTTRRLGRDHPLTLTTLKHEALVHDGLGDYDAAAASMRRAVVAHERALGPDDPATLTATNDLALILVDAGQFDDAEPMVRGVLETRRAVLGPAHPDTLLSLGSLGYVLSEMGRDAEAEPVLRDAVDLARGTLGDDHPRTAAYLYLLATSIRWQDRPADAEPLSAEALAIRRERLGPDHPETMMSLTLQASLLQDLGRLEEAHDLLVERYERGVRTQGADHPSTLIAANNVANVLLDLGRPDDAEPVAAETVAIAKERLPDGYWLVGAFQTNHARALIELGRLDEADAVLRDAHQRLEQALGADHDRVHRVEELQARLAQSRGP